MEHVAVMRGDGSLRWLRNIARDPGNGFRVAAGEWAAAIGEAELVLHNHPNGQAWPSEADLAQQIATALPWMICPRDGSPFIFGTRASRGSVYGRPYRFGHTDCYSCVRDALDAFYDVRIPDYPRVWDWWRAADPLPLFEERLSVAGFQRVGNALCEARPGDGLLFKIRSAVANHCGLVLDDGRMLHHPTPGEPVHPTYVSHHVSLERWGGIPVEVVRRA